MLLNLLNSFKKYSMKDMRTYESTITLGAALSTTDFVGRGDYYKETDIIIFKIYLPKYNHLIKDLKKFLDSHENERATKYFKETDANRFIICRSLLKFALAQYTKSDTNSISIELLPTKKPYMPKHPNVFFNVSHSGDYAVLAIGTNPIGIDIEHVDLNYNFHNTLSYVFNEDEIHFINNSDQKVRAFYNLWTRKEAFVKALGKGIDDNFSKIPCLDGIHFLKASLIESPQHWQVHNFEIEDENYLGAIARPFNLYDEEKIYLNNFPRTMKEILKMNF